MQFNESTKASGAIVSQITVEIISQNTNSYEFIQAIKGQGKSPRNRQCDDLNLTLTYEV